MSSRSMSPSTTPQQTQLAKHRNQTNSKPHIEKARRSIRWNALVDKQQSNSTRYLRQGLLRARNQFTQGFHVNTQCWCNRSYSFSSVILASGASTHARQSLLLGIYFCRVLHKSRFETACCKRWHGHMNFVKQAAQTQLRGVQKRCALFCGRGCTGIKLRHPHPGNMLRTRKLRTPMSRLNKACMKNLSLVSVLSSASAQSCTTARPAPSPAKVTQ